MSDKFNGFIWHPFPKHKPVEDGLYLICTSDGELGIRRYCRVFTVEHFNGDKDHCDEKVFTNVFLRGKGTGGHRYISKNVAFWSGLPDPPEDLTTAKTNEELSKLYAKLEKIQSLIDKLERTED